jgi:glycosyltransferase involved in cell wall biosynthesis
MKILLVVPMVPRADGAGAIPMLLHAQLSGLRERHEVTLVSSVGDEPGEAEAAAALRDVGVDAHFADRRLPPTASLRNRRRLRLLATWVSTRWPWRTVWFASPGVQAIIDRQTAAQRFDVIAVEDPSMSIFRLPADVPAVLTEHEAFRASAPSWADAPLGERPQRLLAKLDWDRHGGFQRQAWRRFDLIQVYSESDAREIAASDPEVAARVRIDPFGIELPAPLDPALEDDRTMLFVGNFTHPPNRDAALWLSAEIMPALRRLHPGVRLRLVGNSPPREVLELAREDIEVVADAPSIEPHLAAAAVVLAPVRTGGGMRMKVLEALARRKAVVTTSRGSEGYTGFEPDPPFVVADDPEEIATAAAALLADPAGRRELARRGREFVERHYTPSAWAERLEQVYGEAIAAGPRRR